MLNACCLKEIDRDVRRRGSFRRDVALRRSLAGALVLPPPQPPYLINATLQPCNPDSCQLDCVSVVCFQCSRALRSTSVFSQVSKRFTALFHGPPATADVRYHALVSGWPPLQSTEPRMPIVALAAAARLPVGLWGFYDVLGPPPSGLHQFNCPVSASVDVVIRMVDLSRPALPSG
jgi:hypothetical protein